MSELENMIAGLCSTTEFIPGKEHPEKMLPLAKSILSLFNSSPVERLEVVKTCGCDNGTVESGPDGATYSVPCTRCVGGEIVRPLTRAEAMALPLQMMNNEVKLWEDVDMLSPYRYWIELPDGGRIRVKP